MVTFSARNGYVAYVDDFDGPFSRHSHTVDAVAFVFLHGVSNIAKLNKFAAKQIVSFHKSMK
jgi:hypothetical protein